jgi:hypothetical protein
VVARLEVELRGVSDDAHHDGVLLGRAVRRVGIRKVRELGQQLVDLALDLRQLLLEALDLLRQRVRLGDRCVGVLAGAFGLRDLLGDLLLRGAAVLDLRQQAPAPAVELQQRVDLVRRAAARERCLDPLRIAADQFEV